MFVQQIKNQRAIVNKIQQLFSEKRPSFYSTYLFSCILFLVYFSSYSQKNASHLKGQELNNSIRLNFIPVKMPTKLDPSLKPTMGLMGLHYTVPINNWLYAGTGMYAATTGDQGGLFTLGFELGIQKELYKNLYIDANFHFGGGGGYRYLVNDGAFINPNIGLNYKQKKINLGIQYSHVNFYTGIIKSNSLSFFLEILSVLRFSDYNESQKDFIATDLSSDSFWKKPVVKNLQQVRFDFFKPIGKSTKDAIENFDPLTETLYVLGFEYQKYISENSFLFGHLGAIYKGLRAGFMDLFFGAGYHPYQSENINLFAKVGIGAAGGRIAPEGGLMIYPSTGIDIKLSEKLAISSHVGYYRALAGDLEAYTYGIGFKHYGLNGGTEGYSKFKFQRIRVDIQNQIYLDVPKADTPTDNTLVDLQLLALKINYDLNNTFYLIGEAGFAYDGESGGYAHGIIGIGTYSPYFFNNTTRAHFETMIGAAGGAGVDTKEGIVIKPTIGLSYKITNRVSLQSSIGKLISPYGDLNATNINIGLSFGISTLSAKNN